MKMVGVCGKWSEPLHVLHTPSEATLLGKKGCCDSLLEEIQWKAFQLEVKHLKLK